MKKTILFLLAISLYLTSAQAQISFSITENIPYKTGDSYVQERCMLDVRVPDKEGSYPVVVWFHGGGLTGGEAYFPEGLLNSEIVLVAVNYRFYPHVEVKDCIDDAAAAVAWTFRNIQEYKGDTAKIIVAGHSAGGYLTSMIGLDKKYLEKYEIDANNIDALFPFSGHTITHFTERSSRGIKGTQAIIDDMAPLYHTRPDAPTIYFMTGDRELEMLGRYEENAYMWRMMKVIGHENSYLFEFDGHGHGAMVAPGYHVLSEYISRYR